MATRSLRCSWSRTTEASCCHGGGGGGGRQIFKLSVYVCTDVCMYGCMSAPVPYVCLYVCPPPPSISLCLPPSGSPPLDLSLPSLLVTQYKSTESGLGFSILTFSHTKPENLPISPKSCGCFLFPPPLLEIESVTYSQAWQEEAWKLDGQANLII